MEKERLMLGSQPNGRAGSAAFLLVSLLGVALALSACESALSPQIGLVLSQPSVEFHAVRGSNTPLTQTITVSNAGAGRLGPVTCATAAAWLSCTVTAGTTITLVANPAGLTQSPAAATVTLTAPGAASPSTVTVNLKVDQPVLSLSASTVAFSSTEATATTSPATSTVTVTNSGAGTLADLGIVTCTPTPANSRVTCAVTQGSGTLTVSVDPTSLAPGTYIYPVTVGTANGGSQTFGVALTVNARPRMALSRQALVFTFDRGSTTPQTQTVTITNTGTGSLGTISCFSPATWLTCSVNSTTLTFTADPSGLTTAPAPVDVVVGASGAINTPLTVSVSLTLTQPVLTLSTDTLTFSTIEGTTTATPASANVIVRVSSGSVSSLGAISCSVPTSAPLTCTVTDSTVTVAVGDPSSLLTGIFVYPVTISAANSNVARTVSVTLFVMRPVLYVTPTSLQMTGTASTTVQVSNIGQGTLADLGTIACTASDPDVTCTVDQSTGVVTISTTAGSLATGKYTRTVTLTAANAKKNQVVTIVWTIP